MAVNLLPDKAINLLPDMVRDKPQAQPQQEAPSQPQSRATPEQQQEFARLIGANRTPLSGLQDIAVGGLTGGQNLAAALGQGGQFLAGKLTGGRAPQVNMREEMGLGENNPVSFQNLIGAQNPNAALQTAAQYAPAGMTGQGIALGGFENALAKIPKIGNVMANILSKGTKPAMYMATQHENPLIGVAEGYGGAAVNEALPYVIPAAKAAYKGVKNAIPEAYEGGKNAINYLFPGQKSKNFLQQLSGTTSEDNASQVAKIIHSSVNTQKADALQHKIPVMKAVGKKVMPNTNNYLGNKNITEHTKNYSSDLEDLHTAYEKNPTFENADKLQSGIGKKIGKLKELNAEKKLDQRGINDWESLIKAKKAVDSDMDEFLKNESPEFRKEYNKFKKKWKTNVVPYETGKNLRMISKGQIKGVRPTTIRNLFAYPKEHIEKILGDLTQASKNRILYNELAHLEPTNAEELVNALHSLKQSKGFGQYMSPEIEQFQKQLGTQVKIGNLIKLKTPVRAIKKFMGF